MNLYVDTSAWISLKEPRDGNHDAAKATLRTQIRKGATLTTGWHTLYELADGLSHHYDQRTAAAEIARLRASPQIRILPSEALVENALALLRDRSDWGVDLSDCLSFSLMKEHGIQTAFTYDTDFEKAGFKRVG